MMKWEDGTSENHAEYYTSIPVSFYHENIQNAAALLQWFSTEWKVSFSNSARKDQLQSKYYPYSTVYDLYNNREIECIDHNYSSDASSLWVDLLESPSLF